MEWINIILEVVLKFIKLDFRKPKVELYIEPNPISKDPKNEFEIGLYINNESKLSVEKIQCMVNFGNSCKIINCSRGILLRKFGEEEWVQFNIDFLHCFPNKTNCEVGKVKFSHDFKTAEMEINYNIVAKNVPYFNKQLKLKIN